MYMHLQDVHTIAAAEAYSMISKSFKEVLASINQLIFDPTLLVGESVYTVKIFLCSDYKANIYIIDSHDIHICVHM